MVYSAEDVHKVAPPHSYIDVRDFKSPKYLAEYLLYLDKNDQEYLSYFKWKRHFILEKDGWRVRDVFCDFCQYLFEDKRLKIMQNFTKWFFDDAECEAFPEQFWRHHSILVNNQKFLKWNLLFIQIIFFKNIPWFTFHLSSIFLVFHEHGRF